MAYSSQSAVSDGLVTTLPISIEYLSRDDIQVYYDDARVYLAEGRWSWVGTTDRTIQFTPSPVAGTVIDVRRVTGIAEMVNSFEDGAQFTAQNLDENFDQVLFTLQEVQENGTTGGGGGGDITAGQVAFTPNGNISATNVQSAIEEVRDEVPLPANNLPSNNGIAYIGVSNRFARMDHTHAGGGGGGGEGTPGTSTGLVYAYKRAVSPPTDDPGDVTFNFTVAAITLPSGDALANGWTKTIPSAGTDPLYVSVASASSSASIDNIAANEWADPVLFVQNGANGAPGLNAATVYLYRRTTTNVAPALPSANVTYQFTPPTVTGLTNSWTTAVPAVAGGEYLWVTTATAVASTATDIIGPSEWAAAQLMARNGVAGSTGSNGVDGQRGTLTVVTSGSSWNNTTANAAIQAVGLGGPFERDICTISNGTSFTQSRFYSGGTWVVLTAYIDGNLLVTGTLSAAKITSGTLSGVQVNFGSGFTPAGKAFEITSAGAVWADNLFVGVGSFDNSHYTGFPSVTAVTGTGSAKAAVQGQVASSNSNSGTAAMYALNSFNGTSGLMAPSGFAYDFYATGSGTNFGPFTGAHDALLHASEDASVGDILIDVLCLSRGTGVSNTIFETTRSSTPNQRAPIGVVAVPLATLSLGSPPAAFTIGYGPDWQPIIDPEYRDLVGLYTRTAVNAVGEGMVNVVGEGGNIQAGDLIVTSSVLGKGMRQADDIVRSYTVAKARESVTFTGDEVKQVACIYLCG